MGILGYSNTKKDFYPSKSAATILIIFLTERLKTDCSVKSHCRVILSVLESKGLHVNVLIQISTVYIVC